MIKRIHVNQHTIRQNINAPRNERTPPIGVETSKEKYYGNTIDILDDAGNVILRFVYRPDDPLKCGARLWAETQYRVRIDGKEIE